MEIDRFEKCGFERWKKIENEMYYMEKSGNGQKGIRKGRIDG